MLSMLVVKVNIVKIVWMTSHVLLFLQYFQMMLNISKRKILVFILTIGSIILILVTSTDPSITHPVLELAYISELIHIISNKILLRSQLLTIVTIATAIGTSTSVFMFRKLKLLFNNLMDINDNTHSVRKPFVSFVYRS